MKKLLIITLIGIFIVSMGLLGTSCKAGEEIAETTGEITQEETTVEDEMT